MKQFAYILTIVFGTLFFQACDKDSQTQESLVDSYDRATMVANYSDGYIIPAYAAYEQATGTLKSASTSFVATPSNATLLSLRTAWKDALLVWQDVAFLEFGPAAQISLRSQTNLYPTDKDQILSNLKTGDYSLQSASNFDAKGFQAIDFLLWGSGTTEVEVLNFFDTNTHATKYLTDLTEELHTNATTVNSAWKGSYASNFKQNTANNAQGSAVNELVNAISLHYEAYTRKGKIALPAGVFNGFSKAPMPDHVEAYYSGESLPYVYRNLEAIRKFMNGETYSTKENKEGFDDYLQFVNANTNGSPLHELINAQLLAIKTALDQLNGPLKEDVSTNPSAVNTVYLAMQKLVPQVKVEVTNALETTITYQDNDGD